MPDPPLWIRGFRLEDVEALYRIDQVCFAPGIAFSRDEFFFYLAMPRSIARIAESAGGIEGFVLARLEGKSNAHIITLDIAPASRRRGIATILMKDLHRELETRRVRFSILEVAVGNIPARELYRKLGYRETGTLTGYYRGIEDACRMKRMLVPLLPSPVSGSPFPVS